jgi:ferrochelatase
VTAATGRAPAWDLVFCSRSGPPSQPWLEPDVNDHLADLARAGVPGVAVAPIGFVSDHMEVRHDLDTEAAETARALGLPFARVATVGTDPRFVRALRDRVLERAAVERESRWPGRR